MKKVIDYFQNEENRIIFFLIVSAASLISSLLHIRGYLHISSKSSIEIQAIN
jgi:hypothetical protein